MARGGKRENAGRKPGIPNKSSGEVKELAKMWGPAAIKKAAVLAGLTKEPPATSEAAQMAAINTILDRAYGKATQPIAGDDDMPAIKAALKVAFVGSSDSRS